MQKPHSSCLTLSLMVTTKSSWSSLRNGTWIVHQIENRGSKKYQSFNTEGRSCPLGREVTETASSFSHNNMSSSVQHSFRHVQPSSWCVSGLAECYCTHRSFSWPVQSPFMPEQFTSVYCAARLAFSDLSPESGESSMSITQTTPSLNSWPSSPGVSTSLAWSYHHDRHH